MTQVHIAVTYSWYSSSGKTAPLTISGDEGEPFVAALERATEGSAAEGIGGSFHWRHYSADAMAFSIRWPGNPASVFMQKDASLQDVNTLVGEASSASPAVIVVSPNDGLGGDPVLEFITTGHAALQTVAEVAGYLSAFMAFVKHLRRHHDSTIRNEVRVAFITHGVSDELIAIVRSKAEWKSSAIEKRFGFTPESAALLMPLCGFDPLVDDKDTLWLRNESFESDS